MAIIKPNRDTIRKVRSKLMSEGMFRETSIKELQSGLMKKRKETKFFQFIQRQQLSQSINVLTHILDEMGNEKLDKNSPPPTTDPGK